MGERASASSRAGRTRSSRGRSGTPKAARSRRRSHSSSSARVRRSNARRRSGSAARSTQPGAEMTETTRDALAGLKVVEIATLFAGPLAATFLGDLGADVLKIEHPQQPDPARHHGPSKDGVGLWWKVIGRNKRLATLDLSTPDGQRLFLRIASGADVVIENFRPGTLERWDLG